MASEHSRNYSDKLPSPAPKSRTLAVQQAHTTLKLKVQMDRSYAYASGALQGVPMVSKEVPESLRNVSGAFQRISEGSIISQGCFEMVSGGFRGMRRYQERLRWFLGRIRGFKRVQGTFRGSQGFREFHGNPDLRKASKYLRSVRGLQRPQGPL